MRTFASLPPSPVARVTLRRKPADLRRLAIKFAIIVAFACEEAFAHLEIRRLHVSSYVEPIQSASKCDCSRRADAPSIGLHTLLQFRGVSMDGSKPRGNMNPEFERHAPH